MLFHYVQVARSVRVHICLSGVNDECFGRTSKCVSLFGGRHATVQENRRHRSVGYNWDNKHELPQRVSMTGSGFIWTVLKNFDVLLTVHLTIILVINQLDAQNLVL